MAETKANFICTNDKETADLLTKSGFKLVQLMGSTYTFLNCRAKQFTEGVDDKKLAYTDMLTL